ncbi:fatty acid synthase-like [Rhynchophorus ferrugineus]|uniref:fatty acid synthase-like n=1 Tax=Rhynchophorus ferrugineus TaxID=354439 RepID=UPI003FCE39E7
MSSDGKNPIHRSFIAHPEEGEEVVISGLSGRFPSSRNVRELQDNLFNKRDMITDDDRRWTPSHPEIPQRTGKIDDIDKFDASFFGIHNRQATSLDPITRVFLEVTVEAIFDAGLQPSDLEGTRTGVFVGSSFSETEQTWFYYNVKPQSLAITGVERSILVNRLSYYLKLKGPSMICDTACSSSMFAIDHAYQAIRTGQCDAAIVGGTSLCMNPSVSLQFARLGVLSYDGSCKVFDNSGNGYVRSETISAVLLQKAKDANRIYATVLHSKTNCDGYKNSGINYPSGEMQIELFRDFYRECDSVSPLELSYMEAHGTGTKVGDPEELQAIDNVFIRGRNKPLLIGSVKSNLGHSEPASGLCSIAKAIIAFETGYIAPNLRYNAPREGVKCLTDGGAKVVTEQTPFPDEKGLIGLNGFGFGGANCHVLLKRNPKKKLQSHNTLPRLITISGRTIEAVHTLLDDVTQNELDPEHLALLQNCFRKTIKAHYYRGYSLVTKNGEITRSTCFYDFKPKNLIVYFDIIDNISSEQMQEFMKVPIFSDTIKKIDNILMENKVKIEDILLAHEKSSISHKLLINTSIQLGLVNVLTALEIKPTKCFAANKGLQLGVLICGYFNGIFSLKEVIDISYAISLKLNGYTDLDRLFKNDNKAVQLLTKSLDKILSRSQELTQAVSFGEYKMNAKSIVDYFTTDNVLNQVRNVLKKRCVVLEIGQKQSCIKSTLNSKKHVSLLSTQFDVTKFLITMGKLYELGFNPQLQHLYPPVQFPVSRGTPMISPAIKWKHDKSWHVCKYTSYNNTVKIDEKSSRFCLGESDHEYIVGHVIDGRNLFPAMGYLYMVWDLYASMNYISMMDMKVIFENCRFINACTMPSEKVKGLSLHVMIHRQSGNFEISHEDTVVVKGRIRMALENETQLTTLEKLDITNQSIFMNKKDIYKELKLRGYNYTKLFRSLERCDVSAQQGLIRWHQNWVAFMDNMLQIKILQEDTRLLYVPINIGKLTIDARKHLDICESFGNEPNIPVYSCRESGIIQSGGIEIRHMIASSIARRKNLSVPVLEKHVFIPNITKLGLDNAIRANSQILLETFNTINIKVIELIDEETPEHNKIIGDIIYDALSDQPLIQPNVTALCHEEIEVKNINVENKKLHTETDCHLVIGSKLLERPNILNIALGSTQESGFIISREDLNFEASSLECPNMAIVTVYNTDQEQLVFLKKTTAYIPPVSIKISSRDTEFSWLPKLRHALEVNDNVVVYTEGEDINGSMGLFKCLRREPDGDKVKLVFVSDTTAPLFDTDIPFYQIQLKKQLPLNIYKNGQWGTYRHLLFEENIKVEREHCYLNTIIKGDLSSLKWIEGPLSSRQISTVHSNLVNVNVYYGTLNFRDVMTALGRINVDTVTRNRREQECIQGLEFSGRTEDGRRVFGMIIGGACASIVQGDELCLVDIPDEWTMKDAATVAVVYSTVIYALIMTAKIKPGDSVLIHSGTGGVGQAAIVIALAKKCTVYTTVGTQEKREMIKKTFPKIPDSHIFNSRDTNFERDVMKATNGKGVAAVLNSLAEEKLLASVRCLAPGGSFLEIGKFDMGLNNELKLHLLKKNCSFHGIMLDSILKENMAKQVELLAYLRTLIKEKHIRPLNYTLFQMNQAEEAFRFMSTGKHTGKVLLEIRNEEDEATSILKTPRMYQCKPRYYCDEDKTYIICGGLGGFGLELADWLILRGCKKLILTSRSGIRTGYQAYRISIWKSYGYIVEVYTDDITTEAGCLSLIKKANELGPVHAIFNLAVVLQDGLFTNQTVDMFKTSLAPKAGAAYYLDKITRHYCQELRDFVMFSSVSCGRGNAGQTNYGMANSIMERICEKRRDEGLPGLAIQWGAIGDVGLVADMQEESIEIEIGGTLQQKITNCLEVLDDFLNQKQYSVVASTVVAEKKSGVGMSGNILTDVAAILGIKDMKSIYSQSTLAEAGMDSMTAAEIKQTLGREYEIFLTPQEMKTITFAKLQELQDNRQKSQDVKKDSGLNVFDIMVGHVTDEAKTEIIPIRGLNTERSAVGDVFLFSGLDGVVDALEPLYEKLEGDIKGIQYCNGNQRDTIEEMTDMYLEIIEKTSSNLNPFKFVCYSFGGTIALETARKLEQKGYSGIVICIDTSPNYLKGVANILQLESEDNIQISLLLTLLKPFTNQDLKKIEENLKNVKTFDERLDIAEKCVTKELEINNTKSIIKGLYKRLKALLAWQPDFKLKSKVLLLKPEFQVMATNDDDYGLEEYTEHPVTVKQIKGNHVSMLGEPELVQEINDILWN